MAGNRSALIIVSSQYNDPELPDLRAPAQGVQALEEVLKDRRIGNFKVETLLNQEHQPLRRAIQRFFDAGRPGDLLLLYLSCHGLKDDDGGLYFAAKDTELQTLAATSVEASFVSQRMERSRSERIVLLLDCYYSGAFPGGVVHLGDAEADIEQRLTGRGRAVISASGAMDYSLTKEQDSVFTDALAHGLGTGEADLNEDGHVSIDELYDYVYEQVTVKTPNQRPHKWLVDVEGSLLIARSPREPNRPVPAPPGLLEAMEERLEASLLRFLPRQRWFSGRGRTLQGTRPWFITTLSSDAPVLVEVVVDVTFTDGYPQRYQIPCGLRTGDDADSFAADHEAAEIGWFVWRGQRTLIYDAVYDPNLGPALLRLLARESRFDKLHFELQPLDIGTPAEIQASSSRLLSVDQTNSSLVCDDKFFLKLFRKVHHGLNIELEVPRSLLSVGFMDLPKPLGWIEIPGSTLAVLYQYYPGSETGWEIAARSVAEALEVTDRDVSILDGDFAPHARRIGALTADLHIALTDALDTISADAADPREYSRMRDQLHGVAREVDELGPFAADIDELFAAVEEAAPRHGLQRIHGDYHLDQVLHVDGDRWIVIDFEGEPVRSLDDRRHLFTPLRDVAGMRRSFDYAAARGLTELSSSDALEERAIEWSSRNRTALLAGYIDRAAPANLLPEQSELLLLALEMDKAVYEVRYEFRHRPDWLPIPLRAVERLLAEFQAYRRRESPAAAEAAVAETNRSAGARRDQDVAATRLKGKIETSDYDVFLCHNSKDKAAVQAIAERLKERGILPWLDVWEIPPGTRWQKALQQQLKSVRSAAVFIGPKGPGPWQDIEVEGLLQQIAKRNCPLIPVILEGRPGQPRLPGFLDLWQIVDMRRPDPDPFEQLVWGITGKKQPPPWV